MSPPSRIDLTELKRRVLRTLGPDKARRYFVYLHRLLSHRLSKVEFDKLCCLTIGHENLPLHNQLIQSVLKNAHSGKVAPPPPVSDITASICTVSEKTSPNEDGYLRSPPPNATNSVVLSNGDILTSPHKRRPAKRDRSFIDRPSPLGPNGRIETAVTHREAIKGEAVLNTVENENAHTYDFKRSIHQHQGIPEHLDNEYSALSDMKKRCMKKSPHDYLHENSNDLAEVARGVSEETWPFVPVSSQSRRPIHAPLGVPFFPVSRGGAYRSVNGKGLLEVSYMRSSDVGELSDTETLRKRMEHIADAEGIDVVPVDCANLLSNALDTYLKKLIRSCLEIARARCKREQIKQPYGNVAQGVNGLWQNHLMHGQPNGCYIQRFPLANSGISISPLDFRAAMELNPQQLGEDWPSLLEKITSRSIEGD